MRIALVNAKSKIFSDSYALINLLFLALPVFWSPVLRADDENPTAEWQAPHTPPLYQQGDQQKASSIYAGASLGIGQSRSTAGGSQTPAKGMAVQFGYRGNVDAWQRYEAGVELLTGQAGYRLAGGSGERATLDWSLGVVLTAGYGKNFGNGLAGLWQIGVGSLSASYKADRDDGSTVNGTENAGGILLRCGYQIMVPVRQFGEAFGGLRITQIQADVKKVRVTDDSGTRTESGKGITVNIPEVVVGLRWHL